MRVTKELGAGAGHLRMARRAIPVGLVIAAAAATGQGRTGWRLRAAAGRPRRRLRRSTPTATSSTAPATTCTRCSGRSCSGCSSSERPSARPRSRKARFPRSRAPRSSRAWRSSASRPWSRLPPSCARVERPADRRSGRDGGNPDDNASGRVRSASTWCPSTSRSRVSCAKVEKVVYAPRKPTTIPTRTQPGRSWRSTSAATTAPARKQPVTLTRRCSTGRRRRRGARSAGRGRSARARRGAAEADGDDDRHGRLLFVGAISRRGG